MPTDTPLIESILLTASLTDVDISARVADVGPDTVAEVMLAEVACRAALLNGPPDKFVIQRSTSPSASARYYGL